MLDEVDIAIKNSCVSGILTALKYSKPEFDYSIKEKKL